MSNNKMTIFITKQELLEERMRINSEQTLLRLLQRKGAPVKGIVLLRVKDGYMVTRNDYTGMDRIKFEFMEVE